VKNLILTSICLIFLVGPALIAADPVAAEPKADPEGYIHAWLVLDPFGIDKEKARTHEDAVQKEFFDKEYFPGQFKATPKENDKVTIDGKELTWRAIKSEMTVTIFDPEMEDALYLVTVYVTSDKEVPNVILSIGSDDGSCWHVNGTEVFRVSAGRGTNRNDDKTKPFTLAKCMNVISVTVLNGKQSAGISGRILDTDGKPVQGLKYSIVPAAK